MADITKITDFDARILSLIIGQFQETNTLSGIIEAMNIQAQDYENAIFELRDEFWLTIAKGNQLDIIGSILGLERASRTDSEYRIALQAWINISLGSGEPEIIISAINLLYNPNELEYIPNYPAKYYLFLWDTTLEESIDVNKDILDSLSPLGVEALQIEPLYFGSLSAFSGEDVPISLGTSNIDAKNNYLYKVR